MTITISQYDEKKLINKLNDLGFNYNKYWNLNIDKIIKDIEKYNLDVEKHVKNNNLDIIKILCFNNKIITNNILMLAIKYNKLEILKFIHLNCNKNCKNIKYYILNYNTDIQNWLINNCSYYKNKSIKL